MTEPLMGGGQTRPAATELDGLAAFPGLFLGQSELADLMRRFDWSNTSIGSPERWPESLKTAIRIILTSRQPFWIGWGEELIYFYNDPYKSIIGGKHPMALGQPTAVVWREIWDDIGPLLASALGGKEGTYVEDQRLIMERNGYPEETYYTFSYSPIFLEDGTPGGIICANSDDTQRVIGERQLVLLRELAADTAEARNRQQVCERAAQAFATNPYDLPFAMIYSGPHGATALTLSSSSGIDSAHPAAPAVLPLSRDGVWPAAAALARHQVQFIADLEDGFPAPLPGGAWSQPPNRAVVLPLLPSGDTGEASVLIAGLNPFRLFDESYSGFLDLVAAQIATAITNAEAYEAERRRAEALAEIDRAKTAFFSNASHEFRTPLTLMLGPLEELLSRSREGRSVAVPYDEIELIHRNGLRLLRLVNTLLDFSRIEAGRFEAAYAPVDLGAFTAELASAFRSAVERAGMRLVVDCPPLAAPVYVDRGMWENIVLNLLSNAFKFTLDGEIAVGLAVEEGGDWAVLTVRDSGVGIPEHELPRLFERFHRIEGQAGRSLEGSGIGLALVHELVKLHGGVIDVASRVGVGTTFKVSIPAGTAHLPQEKIRAEGGPRPAARAIAFVEEAIRWLPGTPAPPSGIEKDILGSEMVHSLSGARPRVLLADDNADMRDYIRRLLETQYEVEAVGDGEAALAAARTRRPDLVLSDVMMPRLDGFGLLQRLRADDDLVDVPVVLLSARAGEEAQIEGLEAGADDYLIKPFSTRELLARIGSNLSLARLRQGAAAVLREETHRLEVLNRTANRIAAELELEPLVQAVTDAATELTGATFGAFFLNVTHDGGESFQLYTLSGGSIADFEGFPQPRNTAVFAPTFSGEGIVRSGDIRQDPRYGRNAPHKGPPVGHLPVVSYLAVPVVAPSGEVLGGLLLAHPEPDKFTAQHELIVAGIASQAAVAFEKARLYRETRDAEASLRQLNETLEQRVEAEVAKRMQVEEALRQAQKMEAIGHLTGGVAHDFNNLLQIVLGNLDTLRRRVTGTAGPTRSEITRSVEGAMRGAERAANLTQRLLAFSRRQPLEPRPFDVNRLIVGMSELLRRTIGESIAIETVLGGGVWRVYADPNQLENSIINLAVNARDAMPAGGKLTIESANAHLDEAYAAEQQEVQPGQYVMVAISDTGTGMTREVIASAFDPFFTTKEVGQGTGLGLSQVYGFVKQSRGHVKIYSELGEGTTVRIYLPRIQGDAPVDETVTIGAMPSGDGSEIILLVEDDEAVRDLNAAMLRELNYAVIEAADGPKALQILEIVPNIRVLFTDVGLPGGMNGRQLADLALRLRPNLRILFTTGYARNAIVHHGRLDPGIDLISKPFSATALATKIRDLLDKM